MMNTIDLKNQLEKTITALERKYQLSGEPIVDKYLKIYKEVFKKLDSCTSQKEVNQLISKLLNGARGYMETSSHYQQGFLNEMGITEKLVKQVITPD